MFIKRKVQQKILEYVRERGKATDKELLELMKKEADVSYNDLLTLIMQLEIEGFVEVHRQKDELVITLKSTTRKVAI